MITVIPDALTSRNTDITSEDVALSSAPVGSSARMTRGDVMSARAMATRCFCPPDNSDGR